jgi:hypothetical protein
MSPSCSILALIVECIPPVMLTFISPAPCSSDGTVVCSLSPTVRLFKCSPSPPSPLPVLIHSGHIQLSRLSITYGFQQFCFPLGNPCHPWAVSHSAQGRNKSSLTPKYPFQVVAYLAVHEVIPRDLIFRRNYRVFCYSRIDTQLTAPSCLTPLRPVVDAVQLINQIGSHDTMTYV